MTRQNSQKLFTNAKTLSVKEGLAGASVEVGVSPATPTATIRTPKYLGYLKVDGWTSEYISIDVPLFLRKRLVLVFKAQEIEPLLMKFVKMTFLRARRLLSSPTPTTCQHSRHFGFQPSQKSLKKCSETSQVSFWKHYHTFSTIAEKVGVHSSEA